MNYHNVEALIGLGAGQEAERTSKLLANGRSNSLISWLLGGHNASLYNATTGVCESPPGLPHRGLVPCPGGDLARTFPPVSEYIDGLRQCIIPDMDIQPWTLHWCNLHAKSGWVKSGLAWDVIVEDVPWCGSEQQQPGTPWKKRPLYIHSLWQGLLVVVTRKVWEG